MPLSARGMGIGAALCSTAEAGAFCPVTLSPLDRCTAVPVPYSAATPPPPPPTQSEPHGVRNFLVASWSRRAPIVELKGPGV